MNFHSIDTTRFYELIQTWNRWASRPAELEDEAPRNERPIVRLFGEALIRDDPKQAHLICGPRRSGKTTVMWQTIRYLVQAGVPVGQIFYVKMDSQELKHETLGTVVRSLLEMAPAADHDNPVYIFADEICKSTDWRKWLKPMMDPPREPVRILGTCSSPLETQASGSTHEERESGIDRWAEHLLLPCNFLEYIELSHGPGLVPVWAREGRKTLKERISLLPQGMLFQEQLHQVLKGFLLFSGYPKLVRQISRDLGNDNQYISVKKAQQKLKEIAERVIYKDLGQEGGIRDLEAADSLFHKTAGRMCALATPGKLANDMQMDSKTISEYLFQLERAHLLFRLRNFAASPTGSKSGNQKFCFFDTGMALAMRETGNRIIQDPQSLGSVWENSAASALYELAVQSGSTLNYWRVKNDYEVDFIFDTGGHPMAFEIGGKERHHKKHIHKLIEQHPEFGNNSYVVSVSGPFVRPEDTRDGVGTLPLPAFLLAVNAQSIQEMLSHAQSGLPHKYIIATDRTTLYPRYGGNKPAFARGDTVFLTEHEADIYSQEGLIEQGSEI